MKNEVIIGDCREVLKTLPEKSVHCCVTSPPYYGLRSYCAEGSNEKALEIGTEQTPEEYVNNLVEVFREVKRVLRDDGTFWLNLGDSYCSNNGFARASKTWQRDGRNDAIANNRNLELLHKSGIKTKDLIGIPWRVAFALQADGWYLRQDIIWQKNNPMPESVRDRCTKAHEYIFLLSKSQKYYFDNEAIKEPCTLSSGGWQSRWKQGKPMRSETSKSRGTIEHGQSLDDVVKYEGVRNKRSVWQVNTKPYKGAHFATFPSKLIEPCILAGTSEKGVCSECGSPYRRVVEKTGEFQRRLSTNNADGSPYNKQDSFQNVYSTVDWKPSCSCNAPSTPATVLDPFAGSGTVGEVCHNLGRNAILIELNPAYVPLIEERAQVNNLLLEAFVK